MSFRDSFLVRFLLPIYLYEPTIWSENEQDSPCCYFEVLQSFKELPLKQCPTCGHDIHRAVTSFSIANKFDSNANASDSYQALDKKNNSPAARAAQLAMRHICRSGCRH
ncbi:FmdB family zinc ribbon protein [Silvanigrella aquatica]|uniref:Uncharacterized protein n=1 Tax=Silvanigrella aquatica TaxID=1915309 RepID=A0A1L4D0M7_9BACT|nr:hypothetical protein [Silvanigrella aquatica]APJ03772.1 hypothetical protein AXG55_07575 [Silvanigrella aquatica]